MENLFFSLVKGCNSTACSTGLTCLSASGQGTYTCRCKKLVLTIK